MHPVNKGYFVLRTPTGVSYEFVDCFGKTEEGENIWGTVSFKINKLKWYLTPKCPKPIFEVWASNYS